MAVKERKSRTGDAMDKHDLSLPKTNVIWTQDSIKISRILELLAPACQLDALALVDQSLWKRLNGPLRPTSRTNVRWFARLDGTDRRQTNF